MRTRRSILVGVGGMIALAGCSQQEGQSSEEEGPEASTGEFTVKQFRVGGERPDEYEAEFIAGSSPEEVADELTPEVSYQISGASGEVETQVRYEYSDATIPEDEPLNETVEGNTHEGSGEYTQSPSMPDSLVSEVVENPKNLAVRFRATDMESEVTETEEYELALADSYIETATSNIFNTGNAAVRNANLEGVSVNGDTIIINFTSQNEIGTQEFKNELANMAGGYSEIVHTTRIPYKMELSARGSDENIYEKSIENDSAHRYLNGEISEGQLGRIVHFDKLLTD